MDLLHFYEPQGITNTLSILIILLTSLDFKPVNLTGYDSKPAKIKKNE